MIRNVHFGFALLQVMLLAVSQSAYPQAPQQKIHFDKDGEALVASRWLTFTVNLETMQVKLVSDNQGRGMGGMGMGGYGSEGGPGAGGEGGPGMGGSGMGGMEMPAMGGGNAGGMGGGKVLPNRTVHAFVFDSPQTNGRPRVEVLVRAEGGMGMGMEGGMGMGMGGMGMGMEGGMGMGGMSNDVGQFVTLEKLIVAGRASKKSAAAPAVGLTPEVANFIRESVCLIVWKRDAINVLRADQSQPEQISATETLLKDLLMEEYDLQLSRQQMELTRLQERLKSVEIEIARRRQAKDRVVDVQFGRLVLEAQGILEE